MRMSWGYSYDSKVLYLHHISWVQFRYGIFALFLLLLDLFHLLLLLHLLLFLLLLLLKRGLLCFGQLPEGKMELGRNVLDVSLNKIIQ